MKKPYQFAPDYEGALSHLSDFGFDQFPENIGYHSRADLEAAPHLMTEALMALGAVARTLDAFPGESEAVLRNPLLPDRRLGFKDQAYWMSIMNIAGQRFDIYAKPRQSNNS